MEPTPESATEQTVPPGCRAEPPYQRPDTRLRIVLSYWLIFFLGLPFWWRTTSIERLALPRTKVEQISNLKNELRIPVSLNLTSKVSGLDIPDLISKLQVTLGKKDAISEALQLSFTDGSPGAVVSQDCGLGSPTACQPLNDHYSIKFVPPTSEHSIQDRSLQLPFHPTSSNFAQDLSNTLTQLLLPPATDTYKLRVAQYAPRYRLAFSLLNEDASVGGGATGWDIEEALARYIEPTLRQLSQLHNFTIESQVQYHAPLAFEPQEVADGFRVDAEDLKVFVNSAEWTLASSSSNDPILHFILFIPSANRSPLHVSDPQGKTSHSNAFVLPQWGGIVVYNAPSQASAPSHLDVQALHSTFHHFDTQLRSLLGVPLLPTDLRHRSSTTITRWQLDSLLRYRALENVRESIDTLQSILKLVDRIKGMPVGEAVRSDFNAALDALNDVYLTYAYTSSKTTLSASARALVSSSKAFFNPNMVAMLYFPVEHKYAVYTPLFAPIAVPLLVSLIRELRDFVKRRSGSKTKSE